MRKLIVLAAGVLILVWANWTISRHERTASEGRRVLLELAPVDPRSLMQGDYMALRFAVAEQAMQAEQAMTVELPPRGRLVLALDENDVGSFARVDDDSALADDEVRVRYRLADGRPTLVTNAFFFEEGNAELYAEARYGELRVATDGDALLVALLGEGRLPLGPNAAAQP